MKTKSFTIKLFIAIFGVLLSTGLLRAQDPEQYGTPYSNVPDALDAVIYQVNMRCFSSTRDFQGVIDRLDNIKALGVNVIYLMPFYPVGTLNAFNSPYCIKDLYSVGPEFGTLEDLRSLVDEAHNKEMAVIIDWVANQTSWDHPWISEHKDWYKQDANGNILQLNNYSDVAALNFSNAEMCAEMIKAMRYWVFTANIDGFRCDYANNPPVTFWQDAISSLRSIETHKLLLLSEGDRSANYTAGFDLNFGFHFYYNSILPIYTNNSSATLINNSNSQEYVSASANQGITRYLSNHDIYGSDGSPYLKFGGKNGTMAAFAVTAFMKSVPFIYNGMEVGNTVAMPFPFNSSAISWTEDESITPIMTKIINIRNNSNAIKKGKLTSYSNADVCAFKKDYETERVFILINLRNSEKSFTLPDIIANTTMRDELAGTNVDLASIISLSAYEYKVFSGEIPISIKEADLSTSNLMIYPNPAINGIVTINLAADVQNANISLFNFQGEMVFESHIADAKTLDLSNVKKGIYFIKIETPDYVESQKLFIKQ